MPTINGSLMHLSSRQAVAGLIISLPVSFFMCGDTLFEVTAQTRAIFFVIFDDGSGNTFHRVGRLPARFAKNRARTPTAWATFTASAVDIIAVSVSIDVFFSPLARRSRKVRTSNSSTASGTLCGIPLWASKRAEALATSSNSPGEIHNRKNRFKIEATL